jgi:hypothetical protein
MSILACARPESWLAQTPWPRIDVRMQVQCECRLKVKTESPFTAKRSIRS